MASFSNVKFNRIFNLERGHKGQFAWKQKNTKNGGHFGIRCMTLKEFTSNLFVFSFIASYTPHPALSFAICGLCVSLNF